VTLLFGPNGFIGGRLAAALPCATTEARIDDPEAVGKILDGHRPSVVINAAGVTGRPNVDWCEEHPAETFRANTIGPMVLAEQCSRRGIHLIHIASGCIFFGNGPHGRPWLEYDPANPCTVYTRSKYAADCALGTYPDVAIVRIRMPIDDRPHARNLVTKLAAFRAVMRSRNSVTFLSSLCQAIGALAHERAAGIFHAVNPGTLTHEHILGRYSALVGEPALEEWTDEATLMGSGALSSPRSSVALGSVRLQDIGVYMAPAADLLDETLSRYALALEGRAT